MNVRVMQVIWLLLIAVAVWASVTDDMLAETLERQGKGEEAQGVREEGQRLVAKAKDVKKETKRYIMFIAIDKSQLGGTSQTGRKTFRLIGFCLLL
jgi:hypothetical protein